MSFSSHYILLILRYTHCLQKHARELFIDDVQLRMTPLEEVFMNVTRKAELEHAEVRRQSDLTEFFNSNLKKISLRLFYAD